MTLKVVEQGKFKYSYKDYDVNVFGAAELEGRVEDRDFIQQLLAAGGVIQPIITTRYLDNEYLIDGRARVLNSQIITKMTEEEIAEIVGPDAGVKPEHFWKVSAKMYYDINPDDQKTWAIILNEERSDNLFMTWRYIHELEKTHKWADLQKVYRINRGRETKLRQFDKLQHPEKWIDAFMKGKVTENTIVAITKIGGYQGFVEEVLEKKGKVTAKDVAEAKTVSVVAAVNNPPFDMTLPVSVTPVDTRNLFIAFDPVSQQMSAVQDFNGALAAKREQGGTWEVYRLVKI